jgi:hypothetical protein
MWHYSNPSGDNSIWRQRVAGQGSHRWIPAMQVKGSDFNPRRVGWDSPTQTENTQVLLTNSKKFSSTSLTDQKAVTCQRRYLAKNHSLKTKFKRLFSHKSWLLLWGTENVFAEGNTVRTEAGGKCMLLPVSSIWHKKQIQAKPLWPKGKQGQQENQSKELLSLIIQLGLPTKHRSLQSCPWFWKHLNHADWTSKKSIMLVVTWMEWWQISCLKIIFHSAFTILVYLNDKNSQANVYYFKLSSSCLKINADWDY